MTRKNRNVIACRTDWFWHCWQDLELEGEWLEIHESDDLKLETLEGFNPRYVFFPHWSTIVSDEILKRFECVCFHATPVPFGRGGSPVQNMIVRGYEETELVALRMTSILDAGPVYARRKVSLLGGGDEIYLRLSEYVGDLIKHIVAHEPEPEEQSGEATIFKRRKPHQSRLPKDAKLNEWFDHIRMLDAEGYPKAFIEYGDLRIEFSRPALRRGHIQADVVIKKRSKKT